MKKIISHSLEETQKIAKDWLAEVQGKAASGDGSNIPDPSLSGSDNKATIIGLSGHLGAGKTAFVKAVAKEFGIKEAVTSPTFVIMKIYDIPRGETSRQKRLIHIDAYRFEKAEELKALNFEQLIADKDNFIMIEWPENVDLAPDIQLNFKALEGEGIIEIEFI